MVDENRILELVEEVIDSKLPPEECARTIPNCLRM